MYTFEEESCLKIPEGPLRCILSGHILLRRDTSHKEAEDSFMNQLNLILIYLIRNDIIYTHGILAQLGEHLPYKQRVTGSSPVGPIFVPAWRNRQTHRT